MKGLQLVFPVELLGTNPLYLSLPFLPPSRLIRICSDHFFISQSLSLSLSCRKKKYFKYPTLSYFQRFIRPASRFRFPGRVQLLTRYYIALTSSSCCKTTGDSGSREIYATRETEKEREKGRREKEIRWEQTLVSLPVLSFPS